MVVGVIGIVDRGLDRESQDNFNPSILLTENK